jgi:hypothetical protein
MFLPVILYVAVLPAGQTLPARGRLLGQRPDSEAWLLRLLLLDLYDLQGFELMHH